MKRPKNRRERVAAIIQLVEKLSAKEQELLFELLKQKKSFQQPDLMYQKLVELSLQDNWDSAEDQIYDNL